MSLERYKQSCKDLCLFDLKSFLFRTIKSDKPALLAGENYLNLGCGPNVVEEMINGDFFGSVRFWRNTRKLEWHLDLRYPLNCEDSVFAGVFAEHVLEHLYVDEAASLLKELFRVMKRGAVLRISVPDLEKYVGFYSGTLDSPDREYFGEKFPSGAAAIRNLTQNYLHRSVWDLGELKFYLEKAGFKSVEKRSYRDCADPKLCLDLQVRAWESLYVEARKV